MAHSPLYQDLYQILKKKIHDGEYEKGTFLPTESESQELYNVSRTTVRKAVGLLVSEGYLEVTRGRGTQILDISYTQNISHVTSTSETLKQKGYDVISKSIYIETVEIDEWHAKNLNMNPGDIAYHIQRVQLADNVPIAIMENYLNAELTPGLEHLASHSFSLYNTLEKHYGIHIDSANDLISCKNADFTESQLLDIKVGFALLVIRRISRSAGKPITYDKVTIRGDRYQFEAASAGRLYC